MSLKTWCLAAAARYRERAEDFFLDAETYPGEPVGICVKIPRLPAFDRLRKAIHRLPYAYSCESVNSGFKFKMDDSGFDARADFLERFAESL